MSQPGDSGWVSWVVGASTVGVALWHIGAKVFGFVTRTELAKMSETQDGKFIAALNEHKAERLRSDQERWQEILRLHRENREDSGQTAEHISALEKGQARIEGILSRQSARED